MVTIAAQKVHFDSSVMWNYLSMEVESLSAPRQHRAHYASFAATLDTSRLQSEFGERSIECYVTRCSSTKLHINIKGIFHMHHIAVQQLSIGSSYCRDRNMVQALMLFHFHCRASVGIEKPRVMKSV